MKKTSMSILLMASGLVSSAAMASGFTVSAGVQGVQLDVETQSKGDGYMFGNRIGTPYNMTSSDYENDIGGEIAVGYQFDFNETYNVALEIFGQIDGAQVNVDSPLHGIGESAARPDGFDERFGREDARAEFDYTAGVRLRPGYNVTNNTRVFLDGGIVWGDFEVKMTSMDQQVLNRSSSTISDTLAGWRYGAGVEHRFNGMENISIVLDYIMTEFESTSIRYDEVIPNNNPRPVGDNRVEYTPMYSTLTLSMKATFDPGFGF